MTDEPRQAGRSHVFSLSTMILALPVLYVLSIGPVASCYKNVMKRHPPDFVIAFYSPLEWLYRNTPMKKPLNMYLAFWKVH